MKRGALTAQIKVNGEPATLAGRPPFKPVPAGADPAWSGWMMVDASKANCVTFPDGLKAVFDTDATLKMLAEDMNARAAP